MIDITPTIRLHEDELQFQFKLASGPGGQNVDWVEQEILVLVEERVKRNIAYRKPIQTGSEQEPSLLSDARDNKVIDR